MCAPCNRAAAAARRSAGIQQAKSLPTNTHNTAQKLVQQQKTSDYNNQLVQAQLFRLYSQNKVYR